MTLKRGYKSSHGEPILRCYVCRESYKTEGKLKRHILMHTNNGETTPFCYNCTSKNTRWSIGPYPHLYCLDCNSTFYGDDSNMKELADIILNRLKTF